MSDESASKVVTVAPGDGANIAMGLYGGDVFDDTNSHEGNWGAFQVWVDCVITSATMGSGWPAGCLDGRTFLAGSVVRIQFTEIELASGDIQVFNNKPVGS